MTYVDPPELDHIVHLVPSGNLHDACEQFRKLGFSVESGGGMLQCMKECNKLINSHLVHADGLTQNALIILTDGVYIELIEFLDKPLKEHQRNEALQQWKDRRSRHWWWGRKTGWIDWCLRGGVDDSCVDVINRASSEVKNRKRVEATQMERSNVLSDEEKTKEKPNPSTQKNVYVPDDLVQYKAHQAGGRRALSGKDIKWNVTFPFEFKGTRRGTFPFWCEDVTPRWWRGM